MNDCPRCAEMTAEVTRLELLLAVARNDAEHFGDVALEHEGMRREAEAALAAAQAAVTTGAAAFAAMALTGPVVEATLRFVDSYPLLAARATWARDIFAAVDGYRAALGGEP